MICCRLDKDSPECRPCRCLPRPSSLSATERNIPARVELYLKIGHAQFEVGLNGSQIARGFWISRDRAADMLAGSDPTELRLSRGSRARSLHDLVDYWMISLPSALSVQLRSLQPKIEQIQTIAVADRSPKRVAGPRATE